ncbi:hypothetical protein [Polyangium sp. 6x1]|uniref:hypothetical protein n=1 Tax=Polyangium sp. 6x1 TaxID=3042689 RepID=UPI0024831AA9|nr:hypothetical protein [Polyangium sp. 6x1]MDI1448802.1 hypothetical protein [Polyangium sp. 6x1]
MKLLRGGTADLVALDGDRVSLRSTEAFAPGAPLAGNLETSSLVRVKVHRCRRQDDGFLVEGRLVDATRRLREELSALLASPAGSGSGDAASS